MNEILSDDILFYEKGNAKRKKIMKTENSESDGASETTAEEPETVVKKTLKRKASQKKVPQAQNQVCGPEDVIILDRQNTKKTVREITAQAIVDEVTKNLKLRARSTVQSRATAKQPKKNKGTHVKYDLTTSVQHLITQYKILESQDSLEQTLKEGSKGTQFNSYRFLTFTVQRFLSTLAKLIQQVEPTFDLNCWDVTLLKSDFQPYSVPVSESNTAIQYLESVFAEVSKKNILSRQPFSKGKKQNDSGCKSLLSKSMAHENSDRQQTKKLTSEVEPHEAFKGVGENQMDVLINQIEQQHNESDDNDEYDNESGDVDIVVKDTVSCIIKGKNKSPVKAVPNKRGAKNIENLLCTYCNVSGFEFFGLFIKHMMVDHYAKKVVEFLCEKCNQCAVISSKSSLGSCINHANGKCLELRTESTKEQFNEEGLTYVKCGLCGFKTEACYEKVTLKLDTDTIVDHFIEKHNAEYHCEECKMHFNTPEIFQCHKDYCPVKEADDPMIKPEIYWYMQNKCGVHCIKFDNEFQYADHSLQFHLLDISGGEISRVLGLHLPVLTTRRDEKLGLTFPCNVCGRDKVNFRTAQEWSEHATNMHKSAGYQCDICCKFLGCIKQHNRNTHSFLDEHYFKCNIEGCQYKGAIFENIISHLKFFHEAEGQPGKMNFLKHCAAPDCEFAVEIEYVDGVLTKDYKKKSRELTSHNENVHKRKFCDKCGKFTSKGYYEQHMESHLAEETGEKKYNCSYCQKSFIHRQSLKDHERRHDEKNKTHVCHQCGKKFFTSGDLCTHVKVSHATEAEKQFICHQCNKGFARRGLLRAHQKQCCPDIHDIDHRVSKNHSVSRKNGKYEEETAVASILSLASTAANAQDGGLTTQTIDSIQPVQRESEQLTDNIAYHQATATASHTSFTSSPHQTTQLHQPNPHDTLFNAITQVRPNDNIATDLRNPVLHNMDNFDPQQRNDQDGFAPNLMQHFPRMPFPQRDLSLESQPQAHIGSFFTHYQQHYQM